MKNFNDKGLTFDDTGYIYEHGKLFYFDHDKKKMILSRDQANGVIRVFEELMWERYENEVN